MVGNPSQVFPMQECTAEEPLAERETFSISRDISKIIKCSFIIIFLFLKYKIVGFLVTHPHICRSTFPLSLASFSHSQCCPCFTFIPFCFHYIHTRRYKYVPTEHTPECGICLPSQSPSLVLPPFPLALTVT